MDRSEGTNKMIDIHEGTTEEQLRSACENMSDEELLQLAKERGHELGDEEISALSGGVDNIFRTILSSRKS